MLLNPVQLQCAVEPGAASQARWTAFRAVLCTVSSEQAHCFAGRGSDRRFPPEGFPQPI